MSKNKNKRKMNFLYKISFIISLMCLPLLVLSMLFGYLFENQKLSLVFSISGAALALIGIILGMLSKPKKQKDKNRKRRKGKKTGDVPEITFTVEEKEFSPGEEKMIDNTPEN